MEKQSTRLLDKARQKAETEAQYRAVRKARKHELIALHNAVVADENRNKPQATFEIGFKSRRIRRDGKIETLPQEFARILKGCEEFISNPKRFPALYAYGGDAINNKQCRKLIAQVLACLLPNTDLIGGRIGTPTEAGLKTISYDQLQEDYALRFGTYVSPKSFAKAMSCLRKAGYFYSERITVNVDAILGEVRSAPAYKQFTERFFADLKVVRYSNIAQMIMQTRLRHEKKGLRFVWISFREMAKKVQEIYNSSKFNDVAENTATIFEAYCASFRPSPH